jgi:PAS domain S-box-containing protein
MNRVAAGEQSELDAARNRLIVRRVRVGLWVGLATVIVFAIANHVAGEPPPRWADPMSLTVALLIGVAFGVWTLPVVQRRPVPYAVLVFASGCGLRTLAGVCRGDAATTAVLLIGLAFLTAATIPWGAIPQTAIASIAGAAIALNSYLVDGTFGPPSGHVAIAIGFCLAISVVLAVELNRHLVQMIAENVGRRRAEERLAQLNAELEQRVVRRTAALDATTQRLEHEVRDHQLAVDEMRESQRRLQEVLDHAMVAIYLRDAEGNYVLVNRYWEVLTGLRAAEVLGKHMAEIIPAPELEALQAHDRRVIESGTAMQFEETVPVADGVRTYVSVKFPQFDREGRPIGVWGISTDISERKRAEEQARRHQAELAHVLRLGTIGEMAAGLAHEINQPLGAATNYARGAVRRLRNGSVLAAELLPILEAIAHETLRAGEIIRRMRDLVRKEPIEQRPVDLNGLVRDASHFVDGEVRQQRIALRLSLQPGLQAVTCNAVQIEQVVLNLLRNAVEAVQVLAEGEGRIAIATTVTRRGAVEVTVSDNGVGLPEPPVDVFTPFYSTKTHGLGMGLSISRSIIEAHQGKLWATRDSGRGSTFHFTLPLRDLGEQALHRTAELPPRRIASQ